VPTALADRNEATTQVANRVIPDIEMVGDPDMGLRIGETQSFPNGTYYEEFAYGGPGLATPPRISFSAACSALRSQRGRRSWPTPRCR
jgi:hypothetical protein